MNNSLISLNEKSINNNNKKAHILRSSIELAMAPASSPIVTKKPQYSPALTDYSIRNSKNQPFNPEITSGETFLSDSSTRETAFSS